MDPHHIYLFVSGGSLFKNKITIVLAQYFHLKATIANITSRHPSHITIAAFQHEARTRAISHGPQGHHIIVVQEQFELQETGGCTGSDMCDSRQRRDCSSASQ